MKKKSKVEQRREKRLSHLECYHKYNVIYLNDEKIAVDYLKYTHPRTNQFGVIGYLQLITPKVGMNVITVKKEFSTDNVKEWSIPFFYAKK